MSIQDAEAVGEGKYTSFDASYAGFETKEKKYAFSSTRKLPSIAAVYEGHCYEIP